MGWLATRAGTLYIARGGKQAASDANRAIAEALAKQHNVLLFAEGTITDGHVKKFHSRLIQSAVDTGCHVQPVAIRYPCPEGNKVHLAALTTADMSFIASAKRLIGAKQLQVEIYFAEAVSAADQSRDELARYAEKEVRRIVEKPPENRTKAVLTADLEHV
jgi:1-acyl-sn-glycerol-3-phosphate acyltransferase